MKKRTSRVSRRIVSLLMSMVLTLTLVTPAAFATEVVGGSGTTIVEGDTNPADANHSEDSAGKDDVDKNTEDSADEQQPANPGDEDDGEDANKPDEDKKDEAPDGENKDEENKDEQPTEDENDGEDDIAFLNDDTDSDVWAGAGAADGIDTSWYNTNDNTFYISTAAQLAGLAQLVNNGNNFSTKNITLKADIKLNNDAVPTSGNQWTPIGTSRNKFAGTFDGQGYTISGLYINKASTYQGLFGYITKDAVIRNLIVTGKVDAGTQTNVGGIVGATVNGATVQNCGFYGAVTAKPGATTTGGVVGAGKALNCWYYRSTDESATELGVCGKKNGATNCYQNVSATVNTKGNYAKSLNTKDVVDGLNTGNTAAGKVWSWTEGAAYPTLIDPPKTITMQPVFPDCTAVVSAGETTLNVENDYTYEVTSDTVTITVSGNIYYAASESEKAYTAAEGGNLTKIDGTTIITDLPKTYYYGTEEDFKLLAAWNSTLAANGNTATVTTADQLKALARMVNSGKDSMTGKTIMLGADIRLNNDAVPTSGNQWTPIGMEKNPFKGTFNGGKVSGNPILGYNLTSYTISNLNGDLFGVVKNGTVQYVTIKGGEGRLVGTLESGSVQYCMSTAKVTGSASGLVGTSTSTGTGTVKNSYYYNAESRNIVAVSGGTVNNCYNNCYYLADVSTWGQKDDTGARTAAEFEAGRVAYELGKTGDNSGNTYWGADNNKLPILAMNSTLCQLALKKLTGPDSVTVSDALQDGDTQYFYGKRGEDISINENGIASGNMATYYPAKPAKVGDSDSTAYYAVGKAITPDTSWYNAAENEFTLTDAADLFGLAQLVNGGNKFSGKTVKLAANIDLTGYIWMPIGSGKWFSGTFDGGNHTITGMRVYAAGISYSGLFGYVYGGTMQNLRVEGSVTTDGVSSVGGIVGQLGGIGTVTNCLSKVNIEGSGKTANVGGIVGKVESGAVNLCWNEGTVTGGSGSTGGIVGNSGGTVTNCANFGEVKGSSTAGGIVGIGAAANSYNLGNVTGAKNTTYGISSAAATNSYYLCKLNDTETAKYVNSNAEQNITVTTEDGKTVYKVGDDVLVNVLNANKEGSYIEWINKQEEPYNPVHITRWDGSYEPGVEGVATLVYDPNGGEGQRWGDTHMVTGNGNASFTFTIKTIDDVGFKHENGTFLGWSRTAGGAVEFKLENGGSITPASVTVKKDEALTLYAVWSPIWAGSGMETDAYQISSAADLTALQTQVNNNGFDYNKKHFKLTSNITLTGEWTPIGNSNTGASFNGNLNGNDKRISGLQITNGSGVAGLFGYLGTPSATSVKATIEKLTIEGSISCNGGQAGGLVGQIRPSSVFVLNNVHTKVSITGSGSDVGGIIGRVGGHAFFTNCSNGASVSGRGSVGGLVGSFVQGGVEFNSCSNSAAVTGTNAAGICAGQTDLAYTEFTGCVNNGAVNGTSEAAGISLGGTFTGCSNNQTVTSSNGNAAGIGINGKAEKCANHAAVSGGVNAAGILWCTSGVNSKIEFCYNTGAISGTYGSYGILAGASGTVKNCFTYNLEKHVAICPSDATGKYAIVINSYYLADKEDELLGAGEWASADDFASGKVAWGVDGGTGAHANYWTQGANNYPVPIGEGTSTSYYRAQATCGTGGTVTIKRGDGRTGDADNAVYGPSGTKVTVTATPKDSSYALKSLTLDLMSTGTTADLANPGSFALGAANAKVVATFASAGSGGGSGSGSGSGSGTGAGDESDEGLQDGVNMDVEYNVKGLVLSAYTEWGSNGGGKTFSQWLKDSPNVLRALISNSLDNMAAAAAAKKTDEASALAQALLASLNEHSGVTGKDGDAISKALQRFMTSGTEATFSTWLATGSGMASGTLESIFAQYTDSLLALADRLYTKWESSGTSMTFPAWLDAQQVSMENLSETAEEPDTDTTDESQTTEAPEDVPDGQESEGQVSGNSIWEIIGTAVRENPIIVWSIVAVVAALVIVGAVRRYHKVKRDERDDNGAE